jgi:hypothetical protein
VAARLRELQERTAAKAEVTRDSILAELEEARVMAKKNGQPAAAVSASMGKAKLVGLVVDRKEVGAPGEFADLEDMTSDELREHFAALVRSLEAEAGFGDTAAIAEGAGKGPPRGKWRRLRDSAVDLRSARHKRKTPGCEPGGEENNMQCHK